MSNPVVEITQGKLKGKVCKTSNNIQYFTFKGIPYAKPPVDVLRFAVPESPEPWDGVRDATVNCNICPQLDRATNDIIGDEDCLYLNVYSPKLPTASSALLPVMVFFHGGGFIFGNGTEDNVHGPDFLIEKDVVLVSLNYRLGILGFLSLDRKEAPGNMGLRDQVQALKWVQKNIKNFSGDPNNVTIFGISAGGASVEYLLLSPMANGLFHKAIAQSGSSLNPWTHRENIKEIAFKIPLLKNKNITDEEELYNYLKDLPIKELISLSIKALSTDKHGGGLYFGFVPTIEKPGDWEPFITKTTYDLLLCGKFTKVPLIMGFCSREGLLMLENAQSIVQDIVKRKNMTDYLPFDIDDEEKSNLEKRLQIVYLEGNRVTKESDDFAIDFLGDTDFIGGIYVAASLIAKKHSPVYFYEFSYDGGLNYLKKKLSIDRSGACHGDDGGYLIKSSILPEEVSDNDKVVRNRMIEMWSNFAKTNDPTPTINEVITTKWEPIAESFCYLYIDDNLTMKENLEPQRTKLFEELYKKYIVTKP